jgi:hypothetical protein
MIGDCRLNNVDEALERTIRETIDYFLQTTTRRSRERRLHLEHPEIKDRQITLCAPRDAGDGSTRFGNTEGLVETDIESIPVGYYPVCRYCGTEWVKRQLTGQAATPTEVPDSSQFQVHPWNRKDWLYEQYWGQLKSAAAIARHPDVTVSRDTVQTRLNQFGIPTRSRHPQDPTDYDPRTEWTSSISAD